MWCDGQLPFNCAPNCFKIVYRWDEIVWGFMWMNLSDLSATNAEMTLKQWQQIWLTGSFIDNILWFGLHFSLARSTKCICESLEEDFRWGCKNGLVILHACPFDVWLETSRRSYLLFMKPYFKGLWGNWVLKHLIKAPEIKPMIDHIRKFQSDWWTAQQGVYMLRDSLCS